MKEWYAQSAVKDDVIEEYYAEEPSGVGETLRHLAMLGARARIAGGMAVGDKESHSGDENTWLEDLARMHEGLVRRADQSFVHPREVFQQRSSPAPRR